MPPEQVELRDVFTGCDPQIATLGHQLLRELTVDLPGVKFTSTNLIPKASWISM
jgi:hypothetical protein